MNITKVGQWKGDNFNEILSKIAEVNSETRIKLLGKRIIIHDRQVNFYQNVVTGDIVEIPVYEGCLVIDEYYEDEVAVLPAVEYNHELSNEMMTRWGLI